MDNDGCCFFGARSICPMGKKEVLRDSQFRISSKQDASDVSLSVGARSCRTLSPSLSHKEFPLGLRAAVATHRSQIDGLSTIRS